CDKAASPHPGDVSHTDPAFGHPPALPPRASCPCAPLPVDARQRPSLRPVSATHEPARMQAHAEPLSPRGSCRCAGPPASSTRDTLRFPRQELRLPRRRLTWLFVLLGALVSLSDRRHYSDAATEMPAICSRLS